jgi:hypothetical protein
MFENEQLRKEKKIIHALMKKFQNAYSIDYTQTQITDTFMVDTIVIKCDSDGLDVFNTHTEEQIISIKFGQQSDLISRKRQKLFNNFLIFARTRSRKFAEKREKEKQQKKAQEAMKKLQEQKRIYLNKLDNALNKLK